ncbi:MAG: purine-nucleoside phosphorylase [Acidobacteriota bacterium]
MAARSEAPQESKIDSAVSVLRDELSLDDGKQPHLAVVLGSGLGDFAGILSDQRSVSFDSISHFPQPTVPGHSGRVISGAIEGVPILCLQGRVHFYEGQDASNVIFAVRVLGRLGIKQLILTNAAGSLNRRFKPGDLMLIRDHIALLVPNPLIGPNVDPLGPRFPDMSAAYSADLISLAQECANRLGILLREGVYVAVTGPSYETPAEVRLLKRLGADVVGMSTVPEVIAARHMKIDCLGLSVITNFAAGISPTPLCHEEVLAIGSKVKPRLLRLLTEVCRRAAKAD